MDGHDSVARIIFAGEKGCRFQLIHQAAQRINLTAQVGVNILAFTGQIRICLDVVHSPRQISVCGQGALQTLLLAHYLLRFLRIRPQIRIGGLPVNFG